MINYEQIKQAWNDQADQFNQWDELSEEEKINFSISQVLNSGVRVYAKKFVKYDFGNYEAVSTIYSEHQNATLILDEVSND